MNVRSVIAFALFCFALPQVYAGSDFSVPEFSDVACAVAIQIVETECLPGDPNTLADDQFMVYANVLGVEGAGAFVSEPFYPEPQAFATNIPFGPFSANDGPVTIVVADAENPDCTDEISVEVPANCGGEDCIIVATVLETDWTPNGYFYTILVDGNGGSNTWSTNLGNEALPYNQPVTFGPFDCQNNPIDLFIFDSQNETCSTVIDIIPVDECFYCDALNQSITFISSFGSDNDTPDDPSDDTWFAVVQVSAADLEASFTSNLGIPGIYGGTYTYGPFPCGETATLVISDVERPDCQTAIDLEPLGACPISDCGLELLEIEYVLEGAIFYVSAFVQGIGNTSTAWQSNTDQQGAYNDTYLFGPFACGESYVLEVFDIEDESCNDFFQVETPSGCTNACAVSIDVQSTFYEGPGYFVTAIISGTGGSGSWWSNTNQTGDYNVPFTFGPFDCGESFELEVFDILVDVCFDVELLTPPDDCSDCNVELVDIEFIPDGELFLISAVVVGGTVGSNGWISNTNQTGLYNETTLFGPFACGQGYNLEVFDASNNGCFDFLEGPDPDFCGENCTLFAELISVECAPNSNLIFYQVEVSGSGEGWNAPNFGFSDVQDDGVYTFGPFDPNASIDLIVLQSIIDPNCAFTLEVPNNCNSDCEIQVVFLEEFAENGIYFVQVVVEGFNTSGSWVSNNGQTGGYGELVTFGPFQCGQTYDILVWDSENDGCNDILIVDSPPNCESQECLITGTILETTCSNNLNEGYFISVVVVNGDNNNGQFLLTTGGIYNYGDVIELGPYPYFESPELTFRDLQDPFCEITLPVTAPECVGCVIGLVPADPIFDDNGTNDPSDDTYSIPVLVLGEHTSGGWFSNLTPGAVGSYGEQFVFGPFPCGSTQILEVIDAENNGCFASLDLTLPNGCPPSGDFYDIGLRKVLQSDGPFEPGAIVEYQLRIRNQGTIAADSIIVTDFPGEGLSFLQANHPNNVIVQPGLSFLILGLEPGELMEIELRFRINFEIDTENIINRAMITFDDGDDIDSNPDQGFDENDLNDNLPDDDESEVIIEDCCQTDPCDFVGVEIWSDFEIECGELPNVNFFVQANDQAPFYLSIFGENGELVLSDTLENDTTFVIEGLEEGVYLFFLETSAGCEREFSFSQQASTNSGVVVEGIEVEDIGCDTPGSVFINLGGNNTADYTFLWSNGAETLNLPEVTEPGDYVLTITVPGGCTEVIEVFVNETGELLPIIFGEGPTTCDGSDGFLTVFTNPNLPNLEYTFLWSTEETTQSIDGLPAGEYSVTVTASNGCSEVLTYVLEANLLVEIEGPNTLGCNGEAITLEATNLGEGYVYSWFFEGTIVGDDRVITIAEPGVYVLVVESVSDPNCVVEIPYTVGADFNTVEVELFFFPNNNECGAAGSIFPEIIGNINNEFSWTWTLPNGQVIETPFLELDEVNQAGTYIFTLTNLANGCTVTAEITLPPGTFGDCVNVTGTLYADEGSCALEGDEIPVPGWPVQIYNADNTLVTFVITDENGNWSVLLPPGEYFATPSPYQDELYTECEPHVSFTAGDATVQVDVLMPYVEECNIMYTYVSMPPLRICEERDIHVYYCNDGPIPAEDAELEVVFEDLLTVEQVSMAPAAVFGQTYVFELGDLEPFECGTITFTVMVSCDATLGQTQCVEVTASPNAPCPTPGENWNGAQVELTVECDENEEEVSFKITNTGDNPMSVPLQYVVIEDVIMMLGSPNTDDPLLGDETMELNLPADGSTYILTTNQEPGSPGPEMPIISIEGCGTDENGEFVTGVVNQFPTSPSDLDWYTVVCRPIVGSYDPNEKVGYPLGYSHDHLIERGTRLTYDLYFQNTGNDFANRVVIVDTLAPELDITTLRVGAGSHDFRYTLDENRVLTFYFDDIMLPDSTTDLAGSQGVVQFSIDHVADLPIGTIIENEVDIYFDFNAPIKTNRTRHQLGEDFLPTAVDEPIRELPFWVVYPNPTDGEVRFEFPVQYQDLNTVIVTVSDWLGRDIQRTAYERGEWINLRGLPAAAYVLRFQDEAGNVLGKADLIVQQ